MFPTEQKLREALVVTRALTRKYLNMVNFNKCDDRQIAELRSIHYQAEEALLLPSTPVQEMNTSGERVEKTAESVQEEEYKGQFAHLFNDDGSLKK